MRGKKHIYTHSKLENVSLIGCISVTCGFKPSNLHTLDIARSPGCCWEDAGNNHTKPLYQAFSHC